MAGSTSVSPKVERFLDLLIEATKSRKQKQTH
jgi:hypothetical protein